MSRRGPIPPSWSVPVQHAYQHVYWQPHGAFYPGGQVGQGPRWAGAPHPLPPAFAAAQPTPKKRGCASAFFGCALVVAGAVVLCVFALVVLVASVGETSPPRARQPVPQANPVVVPPVAPVPPGVIPGPIPEVTGAEVDLGVHTGKCQTGNEERTLSTYPIGWRGKGSAGHLVGRVALVHLRMEARGASFTSDTSRSVTISAAISRKFLMDQARRWSVPGLTIDVIVWPISTPFALPVPRIDARKKIDPASAEAMESAVRVAVESAAGRRLDQVVAELEQRGYAHTAFLVHFPTGPMQIRDFARPHGGGRAAELAFMVAPKWATAERGAIASHEILHLFGAFDLYRMNQVGPDERDEVMNGYCLGLGSSSIGPGTAYAIGWGNPPTDRPYAFGR